MNCLLCGAPPPLVDGQCSSCFAQRVELASLAEIVEVPYCPRCDAIMFGPQWHDSPDLEKALERFLEGVVNFHPQAKKVELALRIEAQDPYSRKGLAQTAGEVEGVPLSSNLSCRMELRRKVCPPCSRQAGGYYEAVLQVRGLERLKEGHLEQIEDHLEQILESASKHDRNLFVAKQERVKGGLNYYLSSLGHARSMAKSLLKRYGGNTGESPRLMGRKEGRNLYRVTLVVRLLPYQRGDILLINSVPAQVIKLDGVRIIYRSLAYGESDEKMVEVEKSAKIRYLGGSEMVQTAQVLSWQEGEAEVMDPETFSTQAIAFAAGNYRDRPETIQVIRHDGRMYPIQK